MVKVNRDVLLKKPPRRGPATAEEAQVTCSNDLVNKDDGYAGLHELTLKAWLQWARLWTGTISDVIVHTELTMPPPPIPAKALAKINQVID